MTALAPGRSCGPCTVCCRVLAIEALAKPAGVLCRHNTGTDCKIYPTRPPNCARWFCLWRKVDALPDGMRPDLSGVMFSLDSRPPTVGGPEGACIVGRIVAASRARGRTDVSAAFAMFARDGGLPLWRVTGRRAVPLRMGPPTEDG